MPIEKRKSQMTSAERVNLCQIARQRARVARSSIEVHAAQQLAHVEQQLAAEYKINDAKWKEITKEAQEKVKQVDAQIAAICKARGVPASFRPELTLGWYRRGENADSNRRAELRRVAGSTLEARVKEAKQKINVAELEILSQIMSDGLTTETAARFLDQMPSVNQLMPALQLAEIKMLRPFSDEEDDPALCLDAGLSN